MHQCITRQTRKGITFLQNETVPRSRTSETAVDCRAVATTSALEFLTGVGGVIFGRVFGG